MHTRSKNIVLFDGVCGLCDKFVEFLLKIDSSKSLYFSPLQSDLAKSLIKENNTETVIFYTNNITYEKSDAVIQIFLTINPFWKILLIFRLIPKSIRDSIYMFISKNRYRLFGKNEICKVPTKEQGERFI
jgi:predicted DCC family thiol-disulfide oxidoreductase YuxK